MESNNPVKTYNPNLKFPDEIKFEYAEKKEPLWSSMQNINKNFRLIETLYNGKSKLINILITLSVVNFGLAICLLFAVIGGYIC